MSVEIIHATPYPAEMVGLAQSITMCAKSNELIPKFTHKKAKFLQTAEHTSLFEHVSYTFLVQGISRSLLAQLTRQRTAKPTSGSQHYQDYSDYPCAVADPSNTIMQRSLANSFDMYGQLLMAGVPKEEARQVLPNAACVNYLWTIDARNLMFFLKLRLCKRNVLEMCIFANKVLALVTAHFPELFSLVGPQCFESRCKQGFMQCKTGPWKKS
jgi:thymidylate synthase (FAD)